MTVGWMLDAMSAAMFVKKVLKVLAMVSESVMSELLWKSEWIELCALDLWRAVLRMDQVFRRFLAFLVIA